MATMLPVDTEEIFNFTSRINKVKTRTRNHEHRLNATTTSIAPEQFLHPYYKMWLRMLRPPTL